MKVCTDACVFGAWVAENIEVLDIDKILDIGSGTGLLSLMLAQKTVSQIDAIEIDAGAAQQSAENFAASKWSERIKTIHTALQEFSPEYGYDCIVCNPPFYENDLRSDDQIVNAARHDTTMKLEELMLFISQQLSVSGRAFILIPSQRTKYAEETAAKYDLFILKKLLMKQSTKHGYFRTVLMLTKSQAETPLIEELSIRNNEQHYTDRFVELLGDYYLKL